MHILSFVTHRQHYPSEENDCKNYFMNIISDWAGIKLTTPGSAVRLATDCTLEPVQNTCDRPLCNNDNLPAGNYFMRSII